MSSTLRAALSSCSSAWLSPALQSCPPYHSYTTLGHPLNHLLDRYCHYSDRPHVLLLVVNPRSRVPCSTVDDMWRNSRDLRSICTFVLQEDLPVTLRVEEM
ncbi:hypothetical protein EXIGLDRAFT_701575 [Exidia glandulosa HHB12029]|uniref:Uncharacterized protein n=1 Tax=Exidia glandulosa HHB12029 TaxID=1314781 RepID=A0A165Q1P2_EXIGL|nr:hypothetical protein EXIGLDRAFT_701575 [Exidia glandulosa HHB12029]